MSFDKVILVDLNNEQIGIESKEKAHRLGLLHKAFSIFLINDNFEILLQKRALDKYHSSGLWSNTCCSHQQPDLDDAIVLRDRLIFEMGIECTKFKHLFDYYYRFKFNDNLYEHEYDQIYLAHSNATPIINKKEVEDYKWIYIEDLKRHLFANPANYTVWLQSIIVPLDSIISSNIINI